MCAEGSSSSRCRCFGFSPPWQFGHPPSFGGYILQCFLRILPSSMGLIAQSNGNGA